MGKNIFIAGTILAAAISLASCSKEIKREQLQIREAVVTVNLEGAPGTKTVLSAAPATDAMVNDVTVLVFKNEGNSLSDHLIDGSYSGGSQLTGITVKATTGSRNIYVVANAHETNFASVANEAEFKAISSNLKREGEGSFTMIGVAENQNLVTGSSATNNITIPIHRMVARVTLSGINADFSGTLLSGQKLSEVKVYITNVAGDKFYFDGETAPSSAAVYNYTEYVAADSPATGTTGMFYDAIASQIGTEASAYSSKHYFYAYQNTLETETETARFTRLVIEANIGSNHYYWPIDINRTGFKGGNTTDHDGIKANCTYDYAVKVTRAGSDNPEDIVDISSMGITLTVTDWTVIPTVNYEF
jgi:hypothetical protein